MRLIVGLLACLSLTALSQVRAADPAPQSTPAATQPAATSSSQTPAASAPAVTVTNSTSAPPTSAIASSTATADKVTIDDVDRKAMSQGYKVSMMRGEKYYCRNEAIVGSRFDRKVCLTPDQMAATQQRAQDDVSRMQKGMQTAKGG